MSEVEGEAVKKMVRRSAMGSVDSDTLEDVVTIDLVDKVIDLGGTKSTPEAFMTMWRGLPDGHLARHLDRTPLRYGESDSNGLTTYVQNEEWTFRNGWMTSRSSIDCARCGGDGLKRRVSFATSNSGFFGKETTTAFWVCTCGSFRDILLDL